MNNCGRIKSVKALNDFIIRAEFINGEIREYDIKPLFKEIEDFETFKTTKGLFEQVKADESGYAVYWNSDLDLAVEEIYLNGKIVKK